jgi:hypothetical protein
MDTAPDFGKAIAALVEAIVPMAIDAAIRDGRITAPALVGPDLGQRRYLTEEEVSVLFGVKKSTLQSWRRKSKGPHFTKPGKHIMYALEDLDAFFGTARVRSFEADSRKQGFRR